MRDFKRMQSDPPEGVNGAPADNDIMKWHAVIFGYASPTPSSFFLLLVAGKRVRACKSCGATRARARAIEDGSYASPSLRRAATVTILLPCTLPSPKL